jgi:hypothetical protein
VSYVIVACCLFLVFSSQVVCLSRSGCAKTLELIASIKGLTNPDDVAISLKCDISNETAINNMVKQATEKFGPKGQRYFQIFLEFLSVVFRPGRKTTCLFFFTFGFLSR